MADHVCFSSLLPTRIWEPELELPSRDLANQTFGARGVPIQTPNRESIIRLQDWDDLTILSSDAALEVERRRRNMGMGFLLEFKIQMTHTERHSIFGENTHSPLQYCVPVDGSMSFRQFVKAFLPALENMTNPTQTPDLDRSLVVPFCPFYPEIQRLEAQIPQLPNIVQPSGASPVARQLTIPWQDNLFAAEGQRLTDGPDGPQVDVTNFLHNQREENRMFLLYHEPYLDEAGHVGFRSIYAWRIRGQFCIDTEARPHSRPFVPRSADLSP